MRHALGLQKFNRSAAPFVESLTHTSGRIQNHFGFRAVTVASVAAPAGSSVPTARGLDVLKKHCNSITLVKAPARRSANSMKAADKLDYAIPGELHDVANGAGKRHEVSKPVSQRASVAVAEYHLPRQVDNSRSFDGLSLSRPFIIGVAGGTASGKTSVCNKIIEQLQQLDLEHQGILSLSQDCFYRDLTPEEQADIGNFNFDHPSAFDFNEIVNTLKRLKAGHPVQIPIYDFVSSARLLETTHVAHADAILFDGILAFYHPELRDLFDLKIFVDTDADTRLARRIRRDIAERGRDVLQVLNQYERTVKPGFESHVRPTKKFADIIVPRGADNTVAIDLILQHIRMKMVMKHVSNSNGSNGSPLAK